MEEDNNSVKIKKKMRELKLRSKYNVFKLT